MLRSIWRFVFPVAKHCLATLMKVAGEAYMQNKNSMGALKAAIKPTVGSLIKSTGEEIERRMNSAASSAAPSLVPPARHWTHVKWERLRRTNKTGRAAKH